MNGTIRSAAIFAMYLSARAVSCDQNSVRVTAPSGEIDYVGGISKCGDRRVQTLLYGAVNIMLTRYDGQLKLKDWAVSVITEPLRVPQRANEPLRCVREFDQVY